MKQAMVTGLRGASVTEVPEPIPKENWVKVKVLAAPLNTDTGDGGEEEEFGGRNHAAAGEVVEVAQPCRVRPGDRVVVQPGLACGRCEWCLSGHFIHCSNGVDFEAFTGSASGGVALAHYLLKPDWLLLPIPEDIPYELAVLAVGGVGPSFAACEAMAIGAFETVLVIGLGPVGLGGVVNAVFRGARVVAVESNPYRARLAQELGAEMVWNPAERDCLEAIREMTEGRGVDACLECSGTPEGQSLCGEAARIRGQIAFVGESPSSSISLAISRHLRRKGLRLHGIWHYPIPAFPRVLQVIRDSPVIGKMITHLFSLDEIPKALETQAGGQCGQILVRPWD
jgi:L-iditol 2-dehydrogenase